MWLRKAKLAKSLVEWLRKKIYDDWKGHQLIINFEFILGFDELTNLLMMMIDELKMVIRTEIKTKQNQV